MKKTPSKPFVKKIRSAALWGLVFFGTFGVALFAYAVGFPNSQPGPASGVVGLYVGSTLNIYPGSMGDYETVDALCKAEYENSHVCTSMEMINTYNHEPAALNGVNGSFWVNEGNLGDTSQMTNDCQGWSTKDSLSFAHVWDATQKQGFLTSCDMQRQFACCK